MVYTRKSSSVEARQHIGPKLNVSSALKGDQIANDGDFLVLDPIAEAEIREREIAQGAEANSFGNRGTVYVVAKDDFLKEFDAPAETPTETSDTQPATA